MITKSDFLLFQEAPLHLWASKNNKLRNVTLSVYDQHLMEQGYEVEKLAHKLFPYADWQKTFTSGEFEVRTDAMIKNNDGSFDLYEIKSVTNIEDVHLYDATFQSIVLREKIKLNRIYIITLNKDYIFENELDILSLFQKNDVTDKVTDLTAEVEEKMKEVLLIVSKAESNYIENCLDPKNCPCLDLCYPDLPTKSIFNIPKLHPKKKRDLVLSNILEIKDIPNTFSLSAKQKRIADVIKLDSPYLNRGSLQKFLGSFVFPIYFLDYETYPKAIPIYKGYKPYQHMVFQYSLHIVKEDGTIDHKEYLETENKEPSIKLLKNLKKDIGESGSVIVWNKTFEFERNKGMALLYPEYKEFLENVNSRMIDLADFINKELYIHPGFLGSWSIKNVLPVMVPDLSYKNLNVNKGDVAMIAWWELIHNSDKSKAKDLLTYCSLDTFAMVKIWEKLRLL